MTGPKVMHRNLFLAGNLQDEDNTCRCCPTRENIVHLVRCGNILEGFWRPVAKVMIEIGFTVPTDYKELEAFWLLGRLTDKKAVTSEQSGMMFIAWRCLYVEIVHSRVDRVPISMQRALNNTMRMTITRLRAYGERWNLWSRINRNTENKSVFPKDKRDRKVVK